MTFVLELTESRGAQFLLDVSLKAAIVLAAAWVLSLILRRCRSSAAARHLVWRLAIGGVLVLPCFTAALPAWSVASPWQWRRSPVAGATNLPGVQPNNALIAWIPMEDVAAQPLVGSPVEG